MKAKEVLEEWLIQTDQSNLKEGHYFVIEEAMKEYAKLKCQELLKMVEREVFQAHIGEYELDIDEIINITDLDSFYS